MFSGFTALGPLLAQEDGAAYRFGEVLGGLLCVGGVVGVVVFVKWAFNPPRRKGGGGRTPGPGADDADRE